MFQSQSLELEDTVSDPLIVRLEPHMQDAAEFFLRSASIYCSTLKDALNRNGLTTVEILSHKLKGSGATIGFPFVSEIGSSINSALRFKDLDMVAKKTKELQYYLEHVTVIYE